MTVSSASPTIRIVSISAAALVVGGLLAGPVAAASSQGRTPYARIGKAPRVPSSAHYAGRTASSQRVSGSVALKARNPEALRREATAVSNPRSASFHRFLAKGAFAAKYGPTAATIAAVEDSLRSADLKVTSVSANHLFVHFSGTVKQAETAFRTHLANYRMRDGRTAMAPSTPVSMPASVSSQVLSVVGLDTVLQPTSSVERGSKQGTSAPRRPNIAHYAGAPKPCRAATQAANLFGGLTDDQIAHAYGVDGLYKNHNTGSGQTVAIYELEPFSQTDLHKFNKCYYGKTAADEMANRLEVVKVDGGAGTGAGSGESILDIDDVSGLAPGANIKVYEAPNSTVGAMDETNQIVQDDTAQQVTTSWGFCELDEVNLEPGYINVGNQLYEQAALQGQTWFASSGDAGSDSCAYQSATPSDPQLSTGDPGTQPFVVGVGGTTITNAANSPTEQVWNDGNAGGGAGGGVSAVWSAPSWQVKFNNKAVAADAVAEGGLDPCPQSPTTAALCRETPDVSLQADEYTGAITVYIGQYGGWNTFGGTSSSAPLWAAILADINASTSCQASGGLGFVAPELYAVASVPHDRKASFNDVTVGNNDVYDLFNGKFFAAHPGYDMASGLGTPKVTGAKGKAGLASYLCALSSPNAPQRPTISGLSPDTVPTVPVGSLTITGADLLDATAVSIGGYPVPAANWSATNDTHIIVSTVPTAAQAGNGGGGPQDGTGRAIVSVTTADGQTTLVTPNATLMYVDGTAASPVPAVTGVSAFGGSKAGGNIVTVFGSGFTDIGPNQITGITVGNVAVASFDVVSPTELTMTIPAYDGGATVCKPGTNPATDVCQTQVVVSNANGDSDKAVIAHPYEGEPFLGASGGTPLPDCVVDHTCEIVPASTEYDYFADPTITSVTTTSDGASPVWVSEQGDTLATVDGKGFDSLGLEYAVIGDPNNANNLDYDIVDITPTEIQLIINGHAPTRQPVVKALTVQTLAGLSNPSPISYAGIPKVTSVAPPYVRDSGGDHITITGKAFQGIAAKDGGELMYQYVQADAATEQLSGYTATSDTSISATTPASNPGTFVVAVCTITFCSEPQSFKSFENSLLDFYEPGDPVVTSISKQVGPASGGTKVVIRGTGLSDAVEVDFGKTPAVRPHNGYQILTNGSSTKVIAHSPPGTAGKTVHVTVTTAESIAEGAPSAKTKATKFHYVASPPSPPQAIQAKPHHTSLHVTWKAPASDGGHPITGYRVSAVAVPNSFKRHAKKPKPVVVDTKNGNARSATAKGLRGGWTYFVKVQAINSLGRGLVGESSRFYAIHQAP
ncbi:MAG: IPT/TIG domain-containing protein [Frankiaceae bacterium]|nr:IPT/TIG domain-containing protein [Frankiaceae bacterium]